MDIGFEALDNEIVASSAIADKGKKVILLIIYSIIFIIINYIFFLLFN
jgi:hypothetical protein